VNGGKPFRIVLQHLLLGMNAHINLDLGIATAQTMKGASILDIRTDFILINSILSSLTNEVLNDLSRVSPLLSLLGLHAATNTNVLIQFSIENARDGGWAFAEELSLKDGDVFAGCIRERDKTIARLANALVQMKGLANLTIWIVNFFEWRSPQKVIKVLREYKKKDIAKAELAAYASA
jgi:hypothetical protein